MSQPERLTWGRFRNGGNFPTAGESRHAAFGIARRPGSWQVVGGLLKDGLRTFCERGQAPGQHLLIAHRFHESCRDQEILNLFMPDSSGLKKELVSHENPRAVARIAALWS